MVIGTLEVGVRRIAVMAAVLGICSAAHAENLTIQGSSTFNRHIMERFQRDIEKDSGHTLTIIPNRTMLGIMAVLEGRAQMSMISAPLKHELAALKTALTGLPHEKLREFPVYITRITLGVHPSNKIRKASADQIRKILTGEITNWSQLGGANGTIRIVLVGGRGGVAGSIEAAALEGKPITAPGIIYVKTAVQLAQVVEQEPTALGFGQLALLQQRGVPELVTDEPIEQALSYVTLGEPTPAMRAVIDATREIAARMM